MFHTVHDFAQPPASDTTTGNPGRTYPVQPLASPSLEAKDTVVPSFDSKLSGRGTGLSSTYSPDTTPRLPTPDVFCDTINLTPSLHGNTNTVASLTSTKETEKDTTQAKDFSCVILTDWLVHNPRETSNPSEIVEFSWIVYDINSGSVLEKVRHVVRPTETPCEAISEATLKTLKLLDSRSLTRTKTLEQVLIEFDTASSFMNVVGVCVISGSVKLRDQLLSETFRKGIVVPKCLTRVLDLSTLASHFYSSHFSGVVEASLSPCDMATYLSIPCETQTDEFYTVNGCMIMCNIIQKMQRDNIHFKHEHLSTVVTAPVSCNEKTSHVEPCVSERQYITTAGPSSAPPQEYIIRLRGVPWGVTKEDVIKFVEPVCIVCASNVYIGTNADGKASGEVYVRLKTSNDRDKCLQELHGRYMGLRWIEVFKASENDLRNVSFLDEQYQKDKWGAVCLRGLPWSTNEYDVVTFFRDAGLPLSVSSVVLGKGYDGRFNGNAWVLLGSVQEAENARRVLHKKVLKKRYIEVFLSTVRELELALLGPIPSGFPRSTHDRSVPYHVMGSFNSPLEYQDSSLYGKHHTTQAYASHQYGSHASAAPTPQSLSRPTPLLQTERHPLQPHAADAQATQPHLNQQYHHTSTTPGCQALDTTLVGNPTLCKPTTRVTNVPADLPPRLYGTPGLTTSLYSECGAPCSTNDCRETCTDYAQLARQDAKKTPPSWVTCVVRMRGLPYHATEKHIVEFFQGYALCGILASTPSNHARPSGEAYVEFVSRGEAWKALKLRNGALMEHRYIELFPAKKRDMELAASSVQARKAGIGRSLVK